MKRPIVLTPNLQYDMHEVSLRTREGDKVTSLTFLGTRMEIPQSWSEKIGLCLWVDTYELGPIDEYYTNNVEDWG